MSSIPNQETGNSPAANQHKFPSASFTGCRPKCCGTRASKWGCARAKYRASQNSQDVQFVLPMRQNKANISLPMVTLLEYESALKSLYVLIIVCNGLYHLDTHIKAYTVMFCHHICLDCCHKPIEQSASLHKWENTFVGAFWSKFGPSLKFTELFPQHFFRLAHHNPKWRGKSAKYGRNVQITSWQTKIPPIGLAISVCTPGLPR